MQKGQIFRKGRSWFVRFWETTLENGARTRWRVCKRLAPVDDRYRSGGDVRPLADELLARVNAANRQPESAMPVVEFIEHTYLPFVRERKRPSTFRGYRDMFEGHVRDRLGTVRLRDFRTVMGEDLLAAIAEETPLSHASLAHIKSFVSGVFTFARRKGILDGANPMDGVSIPEGLPSRETYAYSLEEIQRMLAVLPEPARTAVAVAAFTGLRRSEVRGLRWEDFTGDEIRVARTVWGWHIGKPKTRASKAPVPVLPFLSRALAEHQKRSRHSGYVFAAGNGAPLNLDNLARRIIRPVLRGTGDEWHGWHAFRRGLATNLHRLKVDDKTIQAILRHSDVSTTQRLYIKTAPADAHAAMAMLERVLGNDWATEAKRYVS